MVQLVFISDEGIAELSDGSRWCIAYDQLRGWCMDTLTHGKC